MLTSLVLPLALSSSLAASIALPGGPPVGMDYLAYDAANGRVWVPAGNTGNVDVIDVATGKVTPVGGFPTAPSTRPGRPNRGPSSAAVGDGQIWIGDRADDSVCAVDARTLARGRCIHLPFVACTDGAVAQDLARRGKPAGRLKTGGGVDNIDYAGAPGLLLVASGRDATLTTARVSPAGAVTAIGSAPTAPGARCVVAASDGTGYVADSARGRLIVVKPPPAPPR